MPRWLPLLAVPVLFAAGFAQAQRLLPAEPDPGAQCQAAILAAEQEHRLPPALLGAIARVESGRPRPEGGVAPWPWTLNAEGQGRFFDSKAEAMAAVQALRQRGVTVIDVGCLQVNLHHHPQAFASLEEAFDPLSNARYAGQFLLRLQAAAGDWVKAAGHYHSQTPERAEGYRLRVMAAWPAMAGRLAEERQRLALVAAWQATRGAAPAGNGFHQVALAAAQRAALPAPRQVAARPVAGPRRVGLLEVAEARR